MPPIVIAGVIAGGLGVVGSVAGSAIASDAQSKAGNAQLQASREALAAQVAARNQAIQLGIQYGSQSPQEVAAINQLMQSRDGAFAQGFAQIQKEQAQLDAIDPSVKASGQNLLDLLNGKNSALLAPMQQQRDIQRQQLTNQLASTFGSGYMSSTGAIQALTQFDQATTQSYATIQQQTLQTMAGTYGGLFGAQQQGASSIFNQTANLFGTEQLANSAVLQAQQYDQTRLTNAVEGAFTAQPVNYFGPAQVAGAPFAGQQTMGNTIAGLGGMGVGAAGTIAAASAFGGNGGASPTTFGAMNGSIPGAPMPSWNYSPMSGTGANGYVGGTPPASPGLFSQAP